LSPFPRVEVLHPADRTLGWSVFVLLLAAYLAVFAGLPENPDAEVEFQTTSALVRRQSFALGGTPEAEAILAIEHQGRQGYNVRRGGPGREQEFFGWSGVAQGLVATPLYVVGALAHELLPAYEERHRATTHMGVARSEYFEHLFVGLRNPLLGALTGALVALAARRAGARRGAALLCALGYGLCSFAWPQARGTLSDVQATCFLFLAFALAQGALERLARAQPARTAGLLGFGLALGGAFLTRPVVAPGVAVLAFFFLVSCVRTARPRFPARELALALGPALLCLGFFLWINARRFGDPLESGYGGVVGSGWFLRSPLPGIEGALLSPGSGLLWFAPGILLCLPYARAQLAHGERAPLLLAGALVLALGVPNVIIPSWHGAWSYGPRYLLPLVPFLWFPLGVALERARERWGVRLLAIAALTLGLVVALGGVLVEYTTNIDLSLQAARLEWPDAPGAPEANEQEQEDARFVATKFDWRFATPWAHWRILRHRLAGLGEQFPVRELYFLPRDEAVTPAWEREQGFRHIAWVDLHERLGGPSWPGPALCLALLVLGVGLALRALDPAQP